MPDDLDLRGLHARYEPDAAFRAALRERVEAIVRAPVAPTSSTDPTSPNEEDLLMLTDTRTRPSETPKRTWRWLLPAAAVVLLALGAIVVMAGDDPDESTIAGTTTTTLGSDVVFHDDFSDDSGAWPTTFPFASVEGGQQVWHVEPAGAQEFHRPKLDAYEPFLDMVVDAKVTSVDPDSTIGVYCRKGVANQDFYYFFRLGPAGAVIGAKEPDGVDRLDDIVAEDATFERPAGAFQLTARCEDVDGVTQVTMLVDGVEVLSGTHDAPLPAGYGALEVQAGAAGSATSEVRWDEFTVSAL